MENSPIQYLIDRYISLNFQVHKKAEALIKGKIGDDLTNDQYYILKYIYQTGECTSSDLAAVFEVNKSAITAIINRMVDKGLIERTRDENDRRVIYLTLSDEGKELHQNCMKKVRVLVESIITQFDEVEITSFLDTYEKLAQMINNKKKEELGE
ncbi:MarR family winged helix-turn-helix transcriptional regulator [Bacillus sp. JJ1764]|uniref:MarR family winged helix-turn-helix transcriptional regulator n=1 Tax=Bacillus sp. JJ1764 TaxID=3122964 RepID=UPI00300029CF